MSMALRNVTRDFPNKTYKVLRISLAQFSSEHRIKPNKQQQKIGFETKPDINKIDCDYIGPPDEISKLRPVIRHVPADETPLERELRLKRVEVEEWNQNFWSNHNRKFFNVSNFTRLKHPKKVLIQIKQAFIKANKHEHEDTLSADKMSEFYKSFLDSNWKAHFNYNRDWYKKNFEILLLSYRTKFQMERWFGRR